MPMSAYVPTRAAILAVALCALSACLDQGLPNAAEQAAALEALPLAVSGVARTRRDGDKVIVLRWNIEDVEIDEDRWSWREVEVLAENDPDGARAVTTTRTMSLDPALLAAAVPATRSREAWGLELQCAEAACIDSEGTRTVVDGDGRTSEPLPAAKLRRAEWLFDRFEDRDEAILNVKRALGVRAR